MLIHHLHRQMLLLDLCDKKSIQLVSSLSCWVKNDCRTDWSTCKRLEYNLSQHRSGSPVTFHLVWNQVYTHHSNMSLCTKFSGKLWVQMNLCCMCYFLYNIFCGSRQLFMVILLSTVWSVHCSVQAQWATGRQSVLKLTALKVEDVQIQQTENKPTVWWLWISIWRGAY